MQFEIYETMRKREIEKRVIFEDGLNYPVSHHETLGDFFPVPNRLNTNKSSSYKKQFFNGRIKDAIQTIQNGDGDTLVITENDGLIQENVVYFIDREVGERIRSEFLQEWSQLDFVYAIQLGGVLMRNEAYMLKQDGTILSWNDNYQSDLMVFQSEKEASKYIRQLLAQARTIKKSYLDTPQLDKAQFLGRYLDNVFVNKLWKMMLFEPNTWYLETLQMTKGKKKIPNINKTTL